MGVRINFLSCVTALVLSVSQNPVAAAAYDNGLVAYAAGDYAVALKEFYAGAESGDAGAAHMLSKMYFEGIGVPRDSTLAFKWTQRAAEAGVAQAQFQLAEFLEAGMQGGAGTQGEPDYAAALVWYHRAVQQAYPLAYYNLARLYAQGLGVERSEEQGQMLYRKAASELDVHAQKGDARAQEKLAYMYEKGIGVSRDINKALQWYRRAANQGWAEAEVSLARMYVKGRGVARSTETALKWLRQAAAHGSEQAQRIVAQHETEGEASLAVLD